jgi:hypothetical protein
MRKHRTDWQKLVEEEFLAKPVDPELLAVFGRSIPGKNRPWGLVSAPCSGFLFPQIFL